MKRKKIKQIKFYRSLQAKIIIIFFYFCTLSASPLTQNYQIFHHSKTGKNLFYVLFHHYISPSSLCQPSTKQSSNFTATKLRYCIFAIKNLTEKITTVLGIPCFKKLYLTIVFLSYLLTTKHFWKTKIQFKQQQKNTTFVVE